MAASLSYPSLNVYLPHFLPSPGSSVLCLVTFHLLSVSVSFLGISVFFYFCLPFFGFLVLDCDFVLLPFVD